MVRSIVERDALVGNLLDKMEEQERRIRYLEDTHPGVPGEAAGKLAYYRLNDGTLRAPADTYHGAYPVAYGRLVANMLMLPGLRGCWTMGAFDSSGNAQDCSGHGHHLAYNGNPTYGYLTTLAPFIALDGTADFLSRADEADLDLTGTESYVLAAQRGITLGGWFYFSAGGSAEWCMGKYVTAGDQRSFRLAKNADDTVSFSVSSLGTAASTVTVTSTATVTAATWTFLVGRLYPSTSLVVWVNGQTATDAAGTPASAFVSTADLFIGGPAATTYLTGRVGACFLCAELLTAPLVNALYAQTRGLYGV